MKKNTIFAAVAALLLTGTAAWGQSKQFKLGQWVEIQNAILGELSRSYVDTLPLERMQLAGIDAMLEQLDPYTVYVPEEEQEDFEMMLGKTYGGITIGREHHMWNAGVVAIPGGLTVAATDLALSVCDGMLDDGAEPVTVEQYSLSIALKACTKQMVEADRWIGHYWHNKYYWSRYIAQFFVRSYRQGDTVEQDIERIRHTDLQGVKRRVLVKRTLAKLIGKLY